jgi:phage terminase small subunit
VSDKLTDKQQAFIEAYLTCWNATQAAIDAKYSKKTARVIGPENLSKPALS